MSERQFSLDLVGVEDPWIAVTVNLVALRDIVCQVLRVPASECGPPIRMNPKSEGQEQGYARVYSFQLQSRSVIARVVAPVRPLFKTEAEVAAMEYVRTKTSIPVPEVLSYCSESNNPVGAEWVLMEHVPGVTMGDGWSELNFPEKQRLALDIIDFYDQMYRLRADRCGSIYYSVDTKDDSGLQGAANGLPEATTRGPLRWAPLSSESLLLMKGLCSTSIAGRFKLGPLNEISILDYCLAVPPPSQTPTVFTSEEYVKLVAFNGIPTTRSAYDLPTREKCLELFQGLHRLYPTSTLFGPSADAVNLRFSHGDLHDKNVMIDPQSGRITGIIDWESAAFRPLWSDLRGIGWFDEERQRFIWDAYFDPLNFETDTHAYDATLRAFFRSQMYKRNPDLFYCFLGGIELRAILQAAADRPAPQGVSKDFLDRYYELGYWETGRRGPFPWDMSDWQRKWYDLAVLEWDRVDALKKAQELL
ncbi:hypothetical protein HYPSUDRAFT_69992 [Hypholoma sublateritium FD-334 SS-4]|uniref:Aminoglycoside phosphotransferase domain-containing protein n=1 Tax=Hypholoma sublateritium (strain FD-334 SS-4) TaxID=945553 RepID=A0A0D2NHA1_HYPSF|nr:hypothetical protein HYPSUDRAFT_69992 [Hypholoma sublateritium FD-334 SS-4]